MRPATVAERHRLYLLSRVVIARHYRRRPKNDRPTWPLGIAVLASFIESARDAPLRESLVALLITGVTVAGVIGVWVLEAHRTASWGCG